MSTQKLFIVIGTLLILVVSIFLDCCPTSQDHSVRTSDSHPIQNVTDISRLQHGLVVRFPATVRTRFGSNCIELFTPENFKKYDGDPKWAVSGRFLSESGFMDGLNGTRNAIVTGKMTFVRDETGTGGPCDIVAGQIFEITDIEYF
jgi:hypothetical protein